MIAYELLSANKIALEMLASVSADISDVKHLEMYREYLRLTTEGHKKTYIVQYLSDEYKIGEATIYRIISRLSADITF